MINTRDELLSATIAGDEIYQKLLRDCLSLEPEYLRILNDLPEPERNLLEKYIILCEELDHRRFTLALTI